MADMLDYVRWRGDLPFTVSPPNEVDALIFSTLSYITFRGRAEIHPEEEITEPTSPHILPKGAGAHGNR